jgi:3-phosphoshikimate 1-carboxyvinyltransferase
MSSPNTPAEPRSFGRSTALKGTITVPGDKSISHRSIMFSALAIGQSKISGLLEGEDVLATIGAMRAMGADIAHDSATGDWLVNGVGIGGLLQPAGALDMGNSGTSTRLLMGLIASHNISATFIGDASLSGRPMGRVTRPLSQMGAEFQSQGGDERLPIMMRGLCPAVPINYTLPVASAQVKSAVLLAGLNTPGVTTVIEPVPTRDHSERMLRSFGAELNSARDDDGALVHELRGEADFTPQDIIVPGDISSAAFFIVAALIIPGSDLIINNVGMNPTRTGLITALQAMGGDIAELNPREIGGEPVADLHVRHSDLSAIDLDPTLAPLMIDECPIFFIAAALAKGTTRTSGLEELRVKESDRLGIMAQGLKQLDINIEETADGLIIEGRDGEPFAPQAKPTIASALDHRIAMSFAIAGCMSKTGVEIDDVRPIATSFPVFETLLMDAAQ